MHNKYLHIYIPFGSIILFLIFFLTSCQKVIEVPIRKSSNRLVIEAELYGKRCGMGACLQNPKLNNLLHTGESEDQVIVKISKSVTLSIVNKDAKQRMKDDIPVVNDAKVFIKETTSTEKGTEVPSTNKEGKYILNNFIPKDNTSYTISVEYNNITYTAISTYYPPVPIQEILTEEILTPGFSETETTSTSLISMRLTLKFNDNTDQPNYYLINHINGEYMDAYLESNLELTPYEKYDVINDIQRSKEILYRETNTYNKGVDKDNKPLKNYVELIEIDQLTYRYLADLATIISSNGPGASLSAPGNPQSFWTENGKSSDALGYFIAKGISRASIVVK